MNYNGAIDKRTPEEKAKDFKWEELASSSPKPLEERHPIGYTVRNQDGSGSCVAQTAAKMLEVWDLKHDGTPTVYSATPIYQSRSNKPYAGMNYVDGLGFSIKNGTYLESSVPSQNMSDDQMDNYKVVATPNPERPVSYYSLPIQFDAVVSEIQKTGAVMLWFKASYEEWCKDIPSGNSGSEAVRHSVTGVDAILYKGKEYIIIEDSWGKWTNTSDIPLKDGQRAIGREFFQQHCYFVGAYTSFRYDGGTVKPKHRWTTVMRYGQKSSDIKKLQEVLKYEKFFPSNQECTGAFFGITAKALVQFQVKYGIMDFAYEKDPRKIQAGKKTLAKLNELYS